MIAPPLDPKAVAGLEERRLSAGKPEYATDSAPWLGGALCFAGPGSHLNAATGPGIDRGATADDVAFMASWFESRGAEPRAFLTPYTDLSLVRELGGAGFRLRDTHQVLALDPAARPSGAPPGPDGLAVERLDPSDDAGAEAAARLEALVFTEDPDPPESVLEPLRRMVRHERVVTLLARLGGGGEVVATASLEVFETLGALCGAAVAPALRGQGAQRALIERRLALAAELGLGVVTVSAAPGGRDGAQRAPGRFRAGLLAVLADASRAGPRAERLNQYAAQARMPSLMREASGRYSSSSL